MSSKRFKVKIKDRWCSPDTQLLQSLARNESPVIAADNFLVQRLFQATG